MVASQHSTSPSNLRRERMAEEPAPAHRTQGANERQRWHAHIERKARTRGGGGRIPISNAKREREVGEVVVHPHRTRNANEKRVRWRHTLIRRETRTREGEVAAHPSEVLAGTAQPHRTRNANERAAMAARFIHEIRL